MIIWSVISILIIAIDQLTKAAVIADISPTETIKVIDGILNFVYVKNTGAAFSMLSGKTGLLSFVSVVFCVGVIAYMAYTKPKNKLLLVSVAMLFGGAVGNAIDRIARGFVVDFIETAFIDFPVFNVADIAITVGAALLIVYSIFFDKENVTDDSIKGN